MMFRVLRADEIECRIGTVKTAEAGKKGGVSLLLYKDARCDMNVLDETVGELNWKKSYSRENRNCTVSIWDADKEQWISKEDTGTESNTEAEKGLASDSFKRACVNWGIGRELYTAPFIWIPGATKYDRFYVKSMKVEDRKITGLVICSCDQYGKKTDSVAFSFPRGWEEPEALGTTNPDEKINEAHWTALQKAIKNKGLAVRAVLDYFQIEKPSDISYQTERDIITMLPELAKEAGT